ncbi:3-oxoacyl-[acyl-carrier-protein] reductase isoform X2 [Oryctolagus cuniculus]|uniref:3-ketoacyl-[acyl-carrier-protein] reductase beta subunit n=1 Tax=Oryctolagus cuniculus TaxID=9986 RepID=A0A5F9D7C2_RABIT|nr:3-oxoacyl-[acyl-carrier-protein] reductase isoform X2 [Oryctolagus cuniculus]XP_051698530.1 3-oxoacyl-[acyl-carrier-protein] reductase isoform X2 [Oryctolagus cuniculus]
MNKVCAIFGGSRGIGRAVAQLMAPKGYRLALIARNLEAAKAAAAELGGDHLALSCDVAKEHDVQHTFEEMEKHLGQVNFLVNAAGINRDGLLVRTKTEDLVSQLHTNLLGSMLTCRAAMRTMIQQQGGSIVNVGSIIGLKGNSGQSVYSASKGGLVGFSRALAKEVARKKIRVNVVAPAPLNATTCYGAITVSWNGMSVMPIAGFPGASSVLLCVWEPPGTHRPASG